MLTDTHTETARVLAAMLEENTGAHFLDSGGIPHRDERGHYAGSRHGYGRRWERNRHRDFEAEPATLVNFKYDIEVTHNVYHWLLERVQCDADMQELLHECRADWDGDDSRFWLDVMEMFPDWLRAKRGREVTGLYGAGAPFTVNTYNHDSLLSQVLQFLYFEVSEPGARWGQAYVLLQVHGGCDVRGGYTAPRALRLPGDGAYVLCHADARIYCTPMSDDAPGQLGLDGEPVPPSEPHHWQTGDGCHWYDEGARGHGAGTQLEEYHRREIDDPADWEPGLLCVDEAGHGYCPKCGGQLNAK